MTGALRDIVNQSGSLTVQDIAIRVAIASVLSMVIYVSYWYTHTGTSYSGKFNVSLVTITILTCTVMTVIGNNIALSLGMAGALSIVRFRTAIKDSRDTAYIFWSVIVGLCSGVADFWTAVIGSAAVFVVLLIMGKVRNENRILLIIKGSRSLEKDIEGTVFTFFNRKALLRVKNTTTTSLELIYELDRHTYNLAYKGGKSITQLLYDKEGMEYVNIVTQNDEISG
ncbi:MAG: DUF4956 domain-containing protein [Defluviitaleaceae bacterium]|nr:DUF4956 domain-containing protein [Defluviitaleaceae bacterium]